MTKFVKCLSLMFLAAVLVAPTCLATPITFAQFDGGGQTVFTMVYSAVGGSHNTLSASTPVSFIFQGVPVPVALQGTLNALFTLTATSYTTSAPVVGGYRVQTDYAGTFSLTLITPYLGQSNLVTGTFGPSTDFLGFGRSASIGDSEPPTGEVLLTSDFVHLIPGDNSFFFSLSGINPALLANQGGTYFRAFGAGGSGTISADAVVPEPAALALMGIGLLGLGVLRRRMR